MLAWAVADIIEAPPEDAERLGQVYVIDGVRYRALPQDEGLVPTKVYEKVRRSLRGEPMPVTGEGVYQRYVELMYLQPYVVAPVALIIFICLMYLLGNSWRPALAACFGIW